MGAAFHLGSGLLNCHWFDADGTRHHRGLANESPWRRQLAPTALRGRKTSGGGSGIGYFAVSFAFTALMLKSSQPRSLLFLHRARNVSNAFSFACNAA